MQASDAEGRSLRRCPEPEPAPDFCEVPCNQGSAGASCSVMDRRWTLPVVAVLGGCAHQLPDPRAISTRIVDVELGGYYVDKTFTARDLVESSGISVSLAAGGAAKLTTYDHVLDVADLVRDETRTLEMTGRWTRRGDGIDLELTVADDAHGLGVRDDGPVFALHSQQRLRCVAMVPRAPSPLPSDALVCAFRDIEPPARYTVLLDGVRVLVVGGPRDAISYTGRWPR